MRSLKISKNCDIPDKCNNRPFLILGPLPHPNNPATYGGATVLCNSFLKYLQEKNIPYIFIQQNRFIGRFSPLKNLLWVIYHLFASISRCRLVMVNVSRNGAVFLSPLIWFICKMFNRKMVFRVFGGNFEEILSAKNVFVKFISKITYLNSSLVIGETKTVINYLNNYNDNVYWLPNLRKSQFKDFSPRKYRKRFVFISQIFSSKGINEIIEASKDLPTDYTLDIYGPIKEQKLVNKLLKKEGFVYKGTVSPENVISVLMEYDVLLLPTWYEGEGHPGIIIEAMSLGIPCISTEWKAINEVVQDGKTGFLVEPKNSKALKNAIMQFNESNYPQFAVNAFKKFNFFNEEKKYTELIKRLYNL